MFIPLPAALLLAGWLAPATFERCVQDYAPLAATDALIKSTVRSCATAFDEKVHPVVRARALCYASKISNAKTDLGAKLIIQACDRDNPPPPCPSGQAFDFGTKRCQLAAHPSEIRQPNVFDRFDPQGH